jgi:hypothetical protein
MNSKTKITPKKKNTTIPNKILITFKVLHFFSKTLAVKFALKLFLAPMKYKASERELMMRKSAKQKQVFIPTIKKTITVYEY